MDPATEARAAVLWNEIRARVPEDLLKIVKSEYQLRRVISDNPPKGTWGGRDNENFITAIINAAIKQRSVDLNSVSLSAVESKLERMKSMKEQKLSLRKEAQKITEDIKKEEEIKERIKKAEDLKKIETDIKSVEKKTEKISKIKRVGVGQPLAYSPKTIKAVAQKYLPKEKKVEIKRVVTSPKVNIRIVRPSIQYDTRKTVVPNITRIQKIETTKQYGIPKSVQQRIMKIKTQQNNAFIKKKRGEISNYNRSLRMQQTRSVQSGLSSSKQKMSGTNKRYAKIMKVVTTNRRKKLDSALRGKTRSSSSQLPGLKGKKKKTVY